ELELLEAQIASDSPALGRRPTDIDLPEGCSLFVLIRDDKAQAVRPETVFQDGDKVIAISKSESEAQLREQLIGTAPVITSA
ncbi:MAG: TrkA C-terminal domain-containing protein, partial [Chloroflexota bacterium]